MRRGIGGTDLSAVCAYYRPQHAETWTKWATAADVWMRLVHDVERPRTSVMQRGLDAEPRLRRAYLDAYGGKMRDKPEKWIVPHPRLPFVTVSPDDVWEWSGVGIALDVGATNVLKMAYVEFKSTSWFSLHPPPKVVEARLRAGKPISDWGEPESECVPEPYGFQVQLGLEILDLDVAHLFAGFGTDETDDDGAERFLYRETRRYVIPRDRELTAMALDLAERFHAEHVVTRKPPSVEPRHNKREWSRLLKGETWKATEAQPSP